MGVLDWTLRIRQGLLEHLVGPEQFPPSSCYRKWNYNCYRIVETGLQKVLFFLRFETSRESSYYGRGWWRVKCEYVILGTRTLIFSLVTEMFQYESISAALDL